MIESIVWISWSISDSMVCYCEVDDDDLCLTNSLYKVVNWPNPSTKDYLLVLIAMTRSTLKSHASIGSLAWTARFKDAAMIMLVDAVFTNHI